MKYHNLLFLGLSLAIPLLFVSTLFGIYAIPLSVEAPRYAPLFVSEMYASDVSYAVDSSQQRLTKIPLNECNINCNEGSLSIYSFTTNSIKNLTFKDVEQVPLYESTTAPDNYTIHTFTPISSFNSNITDAFSTISITNRGIITILPLSQNDSRYEFLGWVEESNLRI